MRKFINRTTAFFIYFFFEKSLSQIQKSFYVCLFMFVFRTNKSRTLYLMATQSRKRTRNKISYQQFKKKRIILNINTSRLVLLSPPRQNVCNLFPLVKRPQYAHNVVLTSI